MPELYSTGKKLKVKAVWEMKEEFKSMPKTICIYYLIINILISERFAVICILFLLTYSLEASINKFKSNLNE